MVLPYMVLPYVLGLAAVVFGYVALAKGWERASVAAITLYASTPILLVVLLLLAR